MTGAAADFDDFDRGRRGRSVLTWLILTNFDQGPKKWPVLTYYHPMPLSYDPNYSDPIGPVSRVTVRDRDVK